MTNEKEFWLQNPKNIFAKPHILPECDMSQEEKLNALTRLVILITIILFIAFWGTWVWIKFLLCSLIVILILWLSVRNDPVQVAHYTCGTDEHNIEISIAPVLSKRETFKLYPLDVYE